MPILPTVPTRRPTLLLAGLLVLAPAAAATPPSPGPAAEETVDARIARCLALQRSQPQQALELADALLAEPALEVEHRIKALSCQGMAAGLSGDRERAVAIADRFAKELERHPELPAPYRMRALSNLGAILHGAGQIHRAEDAYAKTMQVAAGIGGEDAALAQISTLNNIALIHADYLDSPQAADGFYRQALAIAASIDRPNSPLLYNFAINQIRLGDRNRAIQALDEAAAAAESTGSVLVGLRVRSANAALRRSGGDRAALAELLQVREIQATLPDPAGEAATLARIASLELALGQSSQALASAQRALELARQADGPQETYQALQALVDVHSARGETRAALDHAGRLRDLKLDTLRQQRLDLLADLQARNQDAVSQRELERMRYEERIRSLSEEKSRMLRTLGLAASLLLMLGAVVFSLMQRRRHRQLRALSERDALTGLSNRRAATAVLNALAMQRGGADTRHVLFLIDIDHFKRINDSHGHHAGDAVLGEMSSRLRGACRASDLVARWGGEEFLVACANLDPARAQATAERLCRAMAHTLETPHGSHPLTVSLGLAPVPFFDGLPEGHAARRWDYALRMADRALYAAKEQRNGWVGYWGWRLPDDATAETALEQPEAADGVITVMSSRPRDPARRREPGPGEAGAAL